MRSFSWLGIAATLMGSATAQTEARRVADRVNQFGLDLQKAMPNRDKNLIFSSYSVASAVGMLFAGAKGTTATEIASTMHWTGYPSLHSDMRALLESVNSATKGTKDELRVANALWPQNNAPILDYFLSVAHESYRAEARVQDYETNAEGARQTINRWVGEQTAGKIPELLAKGILNRDTRLVLTNAIYFKGKWAKEFSKSATSPGPFLLASGTTKTTPMMHKTSSYGYGETDRAQLLELGYTGNRLGLVIVLPKDKSGLAKVEDNLNPKDLAAWLEGIRPRPVEVTLPVFKAETSVTLNDAMAHLGMRTVFTPAADLSGINGKGALMLSALVHKAVIEVNEEGTEAAAATGGVVSLTSAPVHDEPARFTADHPFLYFLRDRMTGCILFAGRIVDPS